MSTPQVDDWAKSRGLISKENLYAWVTRIWVASPGPPLVSRKITGNMLNVQMVLSRITVVLTDRRPGMVMWRKRCQGPAPSISAASYISPGMDWSPPSSATSMKGTPSQMFTAMTENLAQVGSFSHGTASMPPPASSLLRKPRSSL